jgi:hypothetical protein
MIPQDRVTKTASCPLACGPTPRTEGFSHCTVTIQNGSTYTSYDAGATGGGWWIVPETVWGQPKFSRGGGTAPGPSSFVKNVPVPCDCADKAMNDINSSNMTYIFPFQNSNTAAAMMAADCGVYTNAWPAGAWGIPLPLIQPLPPPHRLGWPQ